MATVSAGTRNCPICPTAPALVEVDRNGVRIDACPTCRGIWLDRGELDKLIELEAGHQEDFLAEIRGNPRRDEGTSRHDDDGGEYGEHRESERKKKKRGGFLSDFLDVG